MSRTYKTQAFYDRKAWYAHSYKCDEPSIPWNWRSNCSHASEFTGSKWNYYSYPLCGYKKPRKWKRAMIKNYWNSKQYKRTSNPRKDIASMRWYWD